jgi:hypothetical protein
MAAKMPKENWLVFRTRDEPLKKPLSEAEKTCGAEAALLNVDAIFLRRIIDDHGLEGKATSRGRRGLKSPERGRFFAKTRDVERVQPLRKAAYLSRFEQNAPSKR